MLERILGELGVAIVEGVLPHSWWGAYDRDTHTIYLRPTLAPLQRRSTLAHECAHAVLGHHGHHHRQEREAEELAASWLIDERDFQCATSIYDTPQAVAHELNVLPRDVRAYCRLLERQTRCA